MAKSCLPKFKHSHSRKCAFGFCCVIFASVFLLISLLCLPGCSKNASTLAAETVTAVPEQDVAVESETRPPQEDNSDDAPTAPPEEAESGLPFVQPEIETPLSYDEYFSVDRKYDKNPDDLHGHASPEWLDQLGLVVCTSDDGVLGLYREASNELVIFYTDEEYINYLFTSSYLYIFQKHKILQISYDGQIRNLIYSDQNATIIICECVMDGVVLFFAVKTDENIQICRLYAPEKHLDILYSDIPSDADEHGYGYGLILGYPISNHEIEWATYNPEFEELLEEKMPYYMEKYGIDPNDPSARSTIEGIVELECHAYSATNHYYDCNTGKLCEQQFGVVYLPADRTEADIEAHGAEWWLDESSWRN